MIVCTLYKEMFDHFIITRFNVPVWWDDSGMDQDWLDHRFQLFDRFCYPSVAAQTCKNFKWLVLFDERIDRERLEKYRKSDCFTPVYMRFFDIDLKDMDHTVHKGSFYRGESSGEIQRSIQSEFPFVATTRLDNDDAIHQRFVETVQSNIEPKEEILNIPDGYVKCKTGVYKRSLCHNPFITMVERSRQPKTVYSVPHWKADQFMALKQIALGERLWLQIIHERNFVNQNHFVPSEEEKIMCDFEKFGQKIFL